MTPIIVPVTNTQVRDCIIEAGKKFCETSDMNPQEFGFVLLGVIGIIVWLSLWFWISDRFFDLDFAVLIGGSIVLPLTIAGLLLIF